MNLLLSSPKLAGLVPADRLALVRDEIAALETRCEGSLAAKGVRVRVSDKIDALGHFSSSRRELVLDLQHISRHGEAFVLDTIRHEYAHFLVWAYSNAVGHGATWQAIARELGVTDIHRHVEEFAA